MSSQNEEEAPFAPEYEFECPHCRSDNVTDVTTFGDEHRRNMCLDCDAEYEHTGRSDTPTRSGPTE